MNEQQAAKKPADQPKVRVPKVGDTVRFVGYGRIVEPHHAVVAKVYGTSVVNLAYLSDSGIWLSSTSVRYGAEKAEGTWHWQEDRG